MLKITPCPDEGEIRALCLSNGAAFAENALSYKIFDGDELIGICCFKLTTDGGRIIVLRNIQGSDDKDALVIAGRAALDFIERHGGYIAYFEEKDKETAARLKFTEKEGTWQLDLRGYFDSCEGCGKKI